MRPNLRRNRNQTPLKLVDVDPAPVKVKKPRKKSKRNLTGRKAPIKAPTVIEEVMDAAEQLITL
jgi:hypothetical protein